MTYFFHPDAELELNASVDYYQECKDGLGAEFAYEVQKTIQRILEFPTAWKTLDGEIKKKTKKGDRLEWHLLKLFRVAIFLDLLT